MRHEDREPRPRKLRARPIHGRVSVVAHSRRRVAVSPARTVLEISARKTREIANPLRMPCRGLRFAHENASLLVGRRRWFGSRQRLRPPGKRTRNRLGQGGAGAQSRLRNRRHRRLRRSFHGSQHHDRPVRDSQAARSHRRAAAAQGLPRSPRLRRLRPRPSRSNLPRSRTIPPPRWRRPNYRAARPEWPLRKASLAQGPGYSIQRGDAAPPAVAGTLEGPGYSITREEPAQRE